MMFKFVSEAECRQYRSACSSALRKVCRKLKSKNITAQYYLIGSGARNMVTRNGDGPFDLDYNLEIIKAPDKYWRNLGYLKDTVRVLLDEVTVGEDCFEWTKSSTSCLTAILFFTDTPNVKFSFDVAIVTRDDGGTLHRLIQNKDACGNLPVWNIIPSSHDVSDKVRIIKNNGLWLATRDEYLKLKNNYLHYPCNDHLSFTVYIEAVNNIYNKYFY